MRLKNSFIKIFIMSLCNVLFLMNIGFISAEEEDEDVCGFIDVWYKESRVITHALGGIDGKTYTNSIEALEYNYENGKRYFEADFLMTSDGGIVLNHKWDTQRNLVDYPNGYIPSKEEFKSNLVHYKYSPTTIIELLDFMDAHPDVRIATDIKYDDITQVEQIIEKIVFVAKDRKYEDVLDQFIIQFYSEDNYFELKKLYPFKDWIYALYAEKNMDYKRVVGFCKEQDIHAVLMSYKWVEDEHTLDIFNEHDIKVYVYTLNKLEDIYTMLDFGAYGIYSDYVTNRDLYLREIYTLEEIAKVNMEIAIKWLINP
ncbi:glycerophosphoryl diester phosphodiesterase [Breznakia sp. PF5-3]|uniref:glycerophosphodiester phosphodiesterase family protein n=1 Tax=unclassified Breznakia TaxID=2623764 RepID=UPI002405EED0|nr:MULTISPECIES: glycerophosphodiester phosphodiesterase family protein [unclassified Breznakia]MDF9824698.1 glycerophosphoryl diester phosphodiesterase [Breznakia sp. PM6-1]MDF9835361.1 glycerophosphoryl diester phosphodiesterase [Breznakia sp. PF5-3]MDF9836960.1 glycerophosphoryl diester phosphodiesterase [Breznakia sp. PFB2-8]MDF9859596.1 glycerophosphoryl diester phosphodiesterase [Breznakia sp. PH5-24]